jgi:lysozyme family protein
VIYLDPNIRTVLDDVLRREGWPKPAEHHPADRGGLTRGGVTARNWGLYKGLGRLATRGELDALTEDDLLAFYYQRYVELPKFDTLTDQKLRALAVDWGVTSGPDDPTKAIQRSLRTRGLYDGAVDGLIGPQTKAALFADRDPRQLYRDVYNARIRHYLDIAFDAQAKAFLKTNPTSQLAFARGWIFRCLEFTP